MNKALFEKVVDNLLKRFYSIDSSDVYIASPESITTGFQGERPLDEVLRLANKHDLLEFDGKPNRHDEWHAIVDMHLVEVSSERPETIPCPLCGGASMLAAYERKEGENEDTLVHLLPSMTSTPLTYRYARETNKNWVMLACCGNDQCGHEFGVIEHIEGYEGPFLEYRDGNVYPPKRQLQELLAADSDEEVWFC